VLLPRRYNSASVFVTQRHNDEQQTARGHADDLNPFLAVPESGIDFFDTVCIGESSDGIHEIHAVFLNVRGSFVIVPLEDRRPE
jgi:hypothetical protein